MLAAVRAPANSYMQAVDFLSGRLGASVNLLGQDHYQDHWSENGAHVGRPVPKLHADYIHTH